MCFMGMMMVDFEPPHYRIRIGVTGDRKLYDPVAIEWQRDRLVPGGSISMPIEARSPSSPVRTLLVGKDDEQVAYEEEAIRTHRCSMRHHRDWVYPLWIPFVPIEPPTQHD